MNKKKKKVVFVTDTPREIYDIHLNGDTMNFGGLEWIVDGSIGRMNYPGTWAECTVREYYKKGWKYNHPYEIKGGATK